MTTVFRLLLLFALGLPTVSPALADPPVAPAACKVPGARRITIANFQFSPADLKTFQAEHPQPHTVTGRRGPARRATLAQAIAALLPPVAQQATAVPTSSARLTVGASHGPIGPPRDVGGNATCGVVDVWLYAALDAYSYCNAADKGNGQAYFEVTSPASFNAANHHEQYLDHEQGLQGTCYICVPPPRMKPAKSVAVPRDARTVQPATGH